MFEHDISIKVNYHIHQLHIGKHFDDIMEHPLIIGCIVEYVKTTAMLIDEYDIEVRMIIATELHHQTPSMNLK